MKGGGIRTPSCSACSIGGGVVVNESLRGESH